jgi:hypothetical protein
VAWEPIRRLHLQEEIKPPKPNDHSGNLIHLKKAISHNPDIKCLAFMLQSASETNDPSIPSHVLDARDSLLQHGISVPTLDSRRRKEKSLYVVAPTNFDTNRGKVAGDVDV